MSLMPVFRPDKKVASSGKIDFSTYAADRAYDYLLLAAPGDPDHLFQSFEDSGSGLMVNHIAPVVEGFRYRLSHFRHRLWQVQVKIIDGDSKHLSYSGGSLILDYIWEPKHAATHVPD